VCFVLPWQAARDVSNFVLCCHDCMFSGDDTSVTVIWSHAHATSTVLCSAAYVRHPSNNVSDGDGRPVLGTGIFIESVRSLGFALTWLQCRTSLLNNTWAASCLTFVSFSLSVCVSNKAFYCSFSMFSFAINCCSTFCMFTTYTVWLF